jgi:hypothetical protein
MQEFENGVIARARRFFLVALVEPSKADACLSAIRIIIPALSEIHHRNSSFDILLTIK